MSQILISDHKLTSIGLSCGVRIKLLSLVDEDELETAFFKPFWLSILMEGEQKRCIRSQACLVSKQLLSI